MSIEAPNLYIFPMLCFIQVSHYATAFITIVYITPSTILLFKLSTSLLESIQCDGSLFKSQVSPTLPSTVLLLKLSTSLPEEIQASLLSTSR
ncbi:hypothetical protein L6452_18974 [Arctium lappa]|uniref:Uncharacterized protein n=1 Tax=Arctium lappa TaxID=4217 RepID=A0ACB9B7V9_ARCLA|nr:hypothetical protein L6452_18974 [Arctium lappa]